MDLLNLKSCDFDVPEVKLHSLPHWKALTSAVVKKYLARKGMVLLKGEMANQSGIYFIIMNSD